MKPLIVLVAVLSAAVAIALAQDRPSSRQPGATLKADTELVEVDAFVVDGNGRPVSDLTVGDFEVLEDGVAKSIETFEGIQLEERREARLDMGDPPEPDMRTNIGASIQSRTFVVVLDDLHVSQASAVRVRGALHRFIDDVVTDADHTAVMYTIRATWDRCWAASRAGEAVGALT